MIGKEIYNLGDDVYVWRRETKGTMIMSQRQLLPLSAIAMPQNGLLLLPPPSSSSSSSSSFSLPLPLPFSFSLLEQKDAKSVPPFSCTLSKHIRIRKRRLIPSSMSSSSSSSSSTQHSITEEEEGIAPLMVSAADRVSIQTLAGCCLGIAWYPNFTYNASGGGGKGTIKSNTKGEQGEMEVEFDVQTLYIPPLRYDTATFLGLPLPPFLSIDIEPQVLRGFIEHRTGKVELNFSAKFLFSVGSLYRPNALLVNTLLTTEEAEGKLRSGKGQRMDSTGNCRLVGVASLEPINDWFMDSFLTLPTDCLADMSAQFILSS